MSKRVWFKFSYSEDVVDVVKAFGCVWDRSLGLWGVANDSRQIGLLRAALAEFDIALDVVGEQSKGSVLSVCDERLREYQKEGVKRALASPSGFLFGYEMGLGKTFTVLEALDKERLGLNGNVLIVCPAITRHTWLQQITQWWGEDDAARVCVYTPELKAKLKKGKVTTEGKNIFITSYGLVGDFLEGAIGLPEHANFEAIVLDEAHYLSNPKASRSKDIAKLHDINPDARFYALSGTPARDSLYDIFNLLRIIQPDFWGTWHSLVKRYCKLQPNKYSEWNIVGLRDDRISELQERLAMCSHRVTKQEVKDQLPAFSLIPVFVEEPTKQTKQINSVEDFMEVFKQSGYNKVDYTVEWVQEYLASEETRPLCVCLYHYEVADKVFTALEQSGKASVFYANGRLTPEQRVEEIKRCVSTEGKKVLICTIESIKIGINDLKSFSRVLFGEWHWSPEVITQAMARFHRLDSPEPVEVYGIVMRGTKDEDIAKALQSKIVDIDKVLISGSIEDKLMSSLVAQEKPTEEILSAWSNLGSVEKGEYAL